MGIYFDEERGATVAKQWPNDTLTVQLYHSISFAVDNTDTSRASIQIFSHINFNEYITSIIVCCELWKSISCSGYQAWRKRIQIVINTLTILPAWGQDWNQGKKFPIDKEVAQSEFHWHSSVLISHKYWSIQIVWFNIRNFTICTFFRKNMIDVKFLGRIIKLLFKYSIEKDFGYISKLERGKNRMTYFQINYLKIFSKLNCKSFYSSNSY